MLIQHNLARRICQPNRTESPFSTPKKKTRKKINEKKKKRNTHLWSLTLGTQTSQKRLSLSLSLSLFNPNLPQSLFCTNNSIFDFIFYLFAINFFDHNRVIYIYIKFIRYYHSLPSNYTETRASIWGVLICFGFSRVRVRVFAFAF
jgi:hypothetical protein